MILIKAVAAAAMVLMCGSVGAQSYPMKPIRLVVPQAPGGGNDTIARMVVRSSPTLQAADRGRQSRGRGRTDRRRRCAKSPPDGYTLLLGNVATLAIIPNVQKKMPYDPLKDFAPVSLIASAPLLVGRASLAAR